VLDNWHNETLSKQSSFEIRLNLTRIKTSF
jgi:hypothetical protein